MYDAAANHAQTGIVDVSNVAFTARQDGGLDMSFNLKVDGVNQTANYSLQTAYRYVAGAGSDRGLRITITTDAVLTAGTNGDYTVTIPASRFTGIDANTPVLSTDTRYFLLIRPTGSTGNALRAVVIGDYPAKVARHSVATDQSCINCHGDSGEVGRFDYFGHNHYAAPMNVEGCSVCHDRTGTGLPTTLSLTHELHSGLRLTRAKNGVRDTVTYPTYMENCSVCHQEQAQLDVVNAMPVTYTGCLSCHGSMTSWEYETAGIAEFHATMTAATDCIACHNPDAAFDTVAKAHNGLLTERSGVIWNGVDTSVTEGAKINMQITGIVDDGVNLAISWTAAYAGNPVNPCNTTLAPGAPLFHLGAGPPNANLSMLRSYAQGDDFILGMSTTAPGQALAVNLTATNTACAGNVATTTIPVDVVPAGATRGIVALQGKPRVVHANPAVTAPMQVRAFTPTREWTIGTGALPAQVRRPVVNSTDCLKCHVGSMYQHGGNRIDNVDMCVICHNPASIEQNVRVGFYGIGPDQAYDGKVGETYEMKTMLHAIHSAGVTGAPYVLYRQNQGVFAWAGSDSLLSNWPGKGTQVVFGTDPPIERNHTFHKPTYPRLLNACNACHTPDFDVLPNQAKAMALTIDAGSTTWNDQVDDTLKGASAAACMSCHSSSDGFVKGALDGHAYQFGWFPQVFPEGRKTIIDTVK